MRLPGNSSRRRAGRGRTLLLALGVAGAALASTGFVHEGVQARRQAAQRGWRASLRRALTEARDEAWRRAPAHWRRSAERRRRRGQGYGHTANRATLVQRYDFSSDGKSVTSTMLSADVIRATLRHHEDRLGACLLRHGAKGVDIQFEVGAAGSLQTVTLDLGGAAGRCVRQVLEGVRFPRRSGGRARGNYQLRMQ